MRKFANWNFQIPMVYNKDTIYHIKTKHKIPNTKKPMNIFHPLVARWFENKYGPPTDIQSKAWPVIARGEHALITAPTGSGKTLTAFLWALNRLIIQPRTVGRNPRVVCVSSESPQQ